MTGGYSGIGIETTKALAEAGAFVVVPARRPEVARAALPGVEWLAYGQSKTARLWTTPPS